MNGRYAQRGLLSAAAAGLLVAASLGCGSDEVRYTAPPQSMMQGGVNVSFQKAEADEETLSVKLFVTNMTNQMMTVQSSGFQLRLPNGQLIGPKNESAEPYFIPPQQGHNVWIDFSPKGVDPRKLPGASVLVGGISYVGDPTPRIVGEVPLTLAGPKEED